MSPNPSNKCGMMMRAHASTAAGVASQREHARTLTHSAHVMSCFRLWPTHLLAALQDVTKGIRPSADQLPGAEQMRATWLPRLSRAAYDVARPLRYLISVPPCHVLVMVPCGPARRIPLSVVPASNAGLERPSHAIIPGDLLQVPSQRWGAWARCAAREPGATGAALPAGDQARRLLREA